MCSLIVLKVLWISLGRFERFQPWRKILSNSFPSWVINMMNVQSEKTHSLSYPKKASQRSMEAELHKRNPLQGKHKYLKTKVMIGILCVYITVWAALAALQFILL